MPLPDLSLAEWITIAAASWTILAIAGGIVVGRGVRLADEREQPERDETTVAAYPPPVPAPRPRDEVALPTWNDFDEVMFRWFAEGAR